MAARARASPRLFELRLQLQPPEGVFPHSFEHPADRPECVPACAVEPVTAFRADVHQTCFDQSAQLEGHGAESHVRHCRVDVPG